jgi:hypothetical protein
MNPGDRVYYIPFDGCPFEKIEFGIVKSINEMDLTSLFVVFNCGEDWENYWDYTGQSTKKENLFDGWSGIHKDADGKYTVFKDRKKI